MKFYHPVLLLVSVYEGVPDLASCHVNVGAHTVRIASRARAFPFPSPKVAPVGWLVFYQPFHYKLVPRCLKSGQVKALDTTFEKPTLFSTGFCKIGTFLGN